MPGLRTLIANSRRALELRAAAKALRIAAKKANEESRKSRANDKRQRKAAARLAAVLRAAERT